jgi:hypothetical protein
VRVQEFSKELRTTAAKTTDLLWTIRQQEQTRKAQCADNATVVCKRQHETAEFNRPVGFVT